MADRPVCLVDALEDGAEDSFDGAVFALAEDGLHEEGGEHAVAAEVGEEAPGAGEELGGVGEEREGFGEVGTFFYEGLRGVVEDFGGAELVELRVVEGGSEGVGSGAETEPVMKLVLGF